MCISRRPGSLRVDAFRGHGLSLLEKTTLRGLRTRAVPAGVTTPPLTRTSEVVGYFIEHLLLRLMIVNTIPAEEIHGDSGGRKGLGETPQSDEQNSHRVSFELRGTLLHRISCYATSTPARGGSTAARGKRSVFPERVDAPTIISSCVAVYINYALNKRSISDTM